MSWKTNKRLGDVLVLANGLAVVVLLNVVASLFPVRLDLTEEKRFSIKPQTEELLGSLEDVVFVEVFLEGDLNAEFKRFQKSIRETLEEFRIHSGNKIQYTFTNPGMASDARARNEFIAALNAKGITPRNVIETKDGQRVEKLVFPGALISYGGFEAGVNLLKGSRAQDLNPAIEGIEFELANAIHKLANIDRKRIGLITGHGELDGLEFASLNNALLEQYDVLKISLDQKTSLSGYDAVIIAKPKKSFTDADKYKLDQYIMHGGKVIFLIDRLEADMSKASDDNYFAFPYELTLEDQLFRYGIRINMDLVQDRVSGKYPIVVGQDGDRPQIIPLDWPFFPLVNQYAEHPATRNLNPSLLKFVSSLDTVKAIGVKKTPLLFTSVYSRKLTAPVKVGVNDLREQLKPENFQSGNIALGYLLEGTFTSLYKNRFAPVGVDTTGFRSESTPSRIVVIADGDIARNDVNTREGEPQPLGLDPFTQVTFANQDLLMNLVAYLVDENGLIQARNKDIVIRPLDKEKIRNERTFWQTINVALPIVVIVLFGLVRAYWRKLKYTRF